MNPSIEESVTNPNGVPTNLKRKWGSSFRRIQVAVGGWGVLMLAGGYLHNTYVKSWGLPALLLIWLGLVVIGLSLTQFLAPEFLSANLFLWWPLALLLGFGANLMTYYVFTDLSLYNPSIWHAVLALGYGLVGYFMDRRWWWLAGWEILVAVGMVWLVVDNTTRPAAQALRIGDFVLTKNLGLLFGLTVGIPLLIAALPIWKERYGKS